MGMTQERLRELLQYDERTGEFLWLTGQRAGEVAGTINTDKTGKQYRRIRIGGRAYYAHRLAFLYVEGEMPDEVDHKNGDGLDNRWQNLRKSHGGLNMRNCRPQKKRGGLPVGVYCNVSKKRGVVRYWSVGTYDGQIARLYSGHDLFEAVCARKSWENDMLGQDRFSQKHFGRD